MIPLEGGVSITLAVFTNGQIGQRLNLPSTLIVCLKFLVILINNEFL